MCSQKAPAVIPAERWAPARQTLAPPGARTIRLCRYSGLNAHPRLTLVASALVESPALVRALVSELDRLGALRGPVACPLDDGSQIMALLSYPGARRVTISVGLSGCELVTNGSVHRTAAGIGSSPGLGPRLVAKLERLLDGRPPAPAARHAGDAPAG